jgi:hypothetical protein
MDPWPIIQRVADRKSHWSMPNDSYVDMAKSQKYCNCSTERTTE